MTNFSSPVTQGGNSDQSYYSLTDKEMNRFLPIFLLLFLANTSFSQITITNAVFPAEGDVYYTSQDTATPGVMVTPTGTDQTWVFDSFIPAFADTAEIIAAADGTVGADYPDADVVVPQFGGEGYAKTSGDSVEVLGFYGDGGFGFGSEFNVELNPTMIAFQTPMNYGDTFVDDFAFKIEIDPSDYPGLDQFLDSISPVEIDSVRLTYEATRYDTLDAWGNLTTNHGSFDVLRMKRDLYSFTTLEVKSFGFWVDAGQFGVIPGIGADTTINYDFISDNEKVQIMSITMGDEGEIDFITYKVDPSEVVVPSAVIRHPDIYEVNAFPNPSASWVNIIAKGLEANTYLIEVSDISGRLVYTERLKTGPYLEHRLSVSSFASGQYFYSLFNANGTLLFTQKLVVER